MENLENQSTWTSWSFSCFWPITFVEPEILIKCYGSDFKLDISFLSWLVSKLSESPIFWPWVEENRNLSELHSLWVSARLIWESSTQFEWAPAKFEWAPTHWVRMCVYRYFIFWIPGITFLILPFPGSPLLFTFSQKWHDVTVVPVGSDKTLLLRAAPRWEVRAHPHGGKTTAMMGPTGNIYSYSSTLPIRQL